jgi:uncharacterized membrane protein YqjE
MADARTTPPRAGDASMSELVQRATEQVSKLVHDELALAKAELTEKGKHAGVGIGLFGGAGGVAFYGLGALIATAIIALDLAFAAWLAALIVTVVLFLIAGVLALVGRSQVKRAVPLTPTAAVTSVRADVDTLTAAFRDRGQA